ncbi:hypothetical protein [Reichenbachiella ulvae]|uniref:Uncharacterized protein n=1 Tax=Reichenbachiella ulvae TaxID=2980104 RepID=A0ABT3CY13_9BACT|nr:hypothetical protein [Reichenbachiella ulvae]MCV9388507.1 hypothetical protein [Reichenbachiella ulvae]
MEQTQINSSEMFQDTDTYMDENTAVWSAIPIVGIYKNRLAEIISKIKTAAQEQEAAQVFLGKSLRQVKKDISLKMDVLDDILEAFAEDTDNSTLLAQSSNNFTSYYSLPNEDFETKTKNMIDLMDREIDNLTDYGLTPAQLDDVRMSFNDFSDHRGKPRAYRIASRVATQNIADLIDEGDKTLDRLDKILKRFRRSNPAFYNGYQAARMVVKD